MTDDIFQSEIYSIELPQHHLTSSDALLRLLRIADVLLMEKPLVSCLFQCVDWDIKAPLSREAEGLYSNKLGSQPLPNRMPPPDVCAGPGMEDPHRHCV